MQAAKEKVSDMAASTKAGLDKTGATIEEKAERMSTSDPIKADMATQKKEERIDEAEPQKQVAFHQNAAARGGGSFSIGQPAGDDYGSTGISSADDETTPGGYVIGGTAAETGDEDGGVGVQDLNVAGGVSTGYGSGNTI